MREQTQYGRGGRRFSPAGTPRGSWGVDERARHRQVLSWTRQGRYIPNWLTADPAHVPAPPAPYRRYLQGLPVRELKVGAVVEALVPYRDGPGSKWRPAVVVEVARRTVVVLPITSNAVSAVHLRGVLVQSWEQAGLHSKSVMLWQPVQISRGMTRTIFGSLGAADLEVMERWLDTDAAAAALVGLVKRFPITPASVRAMSTLLSRRPGHALAALTAAHPNLPSLSPATPAALPASAVTMFEVRPLRGPADLAAAARGSARQPVTSGLADRIVASDLVTQASLTATAPAISGPAPAAGPALLAWRARRRSLVA